MNKLELHTKKKSKKDSPDLEKHTTLNVLVFSSLPADSGCYLRAGYLTASLLRNGARARLIPEPKGVSFVLHMALSFFRNLWICLTTEFDVGICIKPYPNTLWPLLLKKHLKRRFVVVSDIDDIDYGYRKGFVPIISAMLQIPFPRFCDLVTYHNDKLYTYIQETFKVDKARLYRLDQGVDFSFYGKMDRTKIALLRKKIIQESGLASPKILVYSAHLNIASDLDEILEAYKIVLRKRSDVYLVIAGGGPMLEDFRRMSVRMGLGEKVFFTGHLSPLQVAQHVSTADLALVYYKDKTVNYYRTSMKIREYMALGRPVVCNDVGDLKLFRKYATMSGSGAENFSDGILKALRTRPGGQTRAGQIFIRKKYDWMMIGRAFLEKLKMLRQ